MAIHETFDQNEPSLGAQLLKPDVDCQVVHKTHLKQPSPTHSNPSQITISTPNVTKEHIDTSAELSWYLQNNLYDHRFNIHAMEEPGTFETLGHASFCVQHNAKQALITRVFKFKQDVFDIYLTLYEDPPTWYPHFFSRPMVCENLIIVEEVFVDGLHGGYTLQDFIRSSYSAQTAKDFGGAFAEVAGYFDRKDILFFDGHPSNLRVAYNPSKNYLVMCPDYLSNCIVLKNIADVCNEDGAVDWARLGLSAIVTPETHNIATCASQLSIQPFTYVQPKPIAMFCVGLTMAQILLQDLSADSRIIHEVSEVTMEEFDEFNQPDNNRWDDPYKVRIQQCLTGLIRHSKLAIVPSSSSSTSGNGYGLVEFFSEMFGIIHKRDEEYSSFIEADRLENTSDLLNRIYDVDLEYLGYIDVADRRSSNDHDGEHAAEEQAKKLLFQHYNERLASAASLTKISNPHCALGVKCCVTFKGEEEEKMETKLDGGGVVADDSCQPTSSSEHEERTAVYRVFLTNTERGRHVYNCYQKVYAEQRGGNEFALQCFPRVLDIRVYVNVFVVREQWVNGHDLFDYLTKVVSMYPNDELRKVEQLELVRQLFVVVDLLHKWKFIHGDISACNFIVHDGILKIIDLESSVDKSNTQTPARIGGSGFYDFNLLRMWVKPNYSSFEIEYFKAFQRQCFRGKQPRMFMTLDQIDWFAVGVLSLQILTLSDVPRETCLGRNGCFSRTVFRYNVSQRLRLSYRSCNLERSIFDALFQDFMIETSVDGTVWLMSQRPSAGSLIRVVDKLLEHWKGRVDSF